MDEFVHDEFAFLEGAGGVVDDAFATDIDTLKQALKVAALITRPVIPLEMVVEQLLLLHLLESELGKKDELLRYLLIFLDLLDCLVEVVLEEGSTVLCVFLVDKCDHDVADTELLQQWLLHHFYRVKIYCNS